MGSISSQHNVILMLILQKIFATGLKSAFSGKGLFTIKPISMYACEKRMDTAVLQPSSYNATLFYLNHAHAHEPRGESLSNSKFNHLPIMRTGQMWWIRGCATKANPVFALRKASWWKVETKGNITLFCDSPGFEVPDHIRGKSLERCNPLFTVLT